MHKKLALFVFPFFALAFGVVVGGIVVATRVEERLSAYGILGKRTILSSFKAPLAFGRLRLPSRKNLLMTPIRRQTDVLGATSAALSKKPSPASSSPTPRMTISPTPVPTVSTDPISGCRQDCTSVACPTGLTCTVIDSDDGYFDYVCLNASCTPKTQGETCQCPFSTPAVFPLKAK